MDLIHGELRNHLDPTAIRILKKRLVSGKITPQVFKDILKRQMIKYFFQSYRHPLITACENYWRSASNRLRDPGNVTLNPRNKKLAAPDHKRF